ncbi:MAG: hypothetical protein ACREKN_03800 [Longimicrobiaceae bacterium]
MVDGFPLRVVDGETLDGELRGLLRPEGTVQQGEGRTHPLPRFFIEVPSWQAAKDIRLTPNFALYEFMDVDVREAERARAFPRYVPYAVVHLAAHLEILRRQADTYVHVSANGGYRTPAHALSGPGSPHSWGTAADVYRVGDDWLDNRDTAEKYARLAREVSPALSARPYRKLDDHLHLDIGYLAANPG